MASLCYTYVPREAKTGYRRIFLRTSSPMKLLRSSDVIEVLLRRIMGEEPGEMRLSNRESCEARRL